MNLTEEQQQQILEAWETNLDSPPALIDLTKMLFPDEDIDGRSKEGRAVKDFLASQNLKARGTHEYQAK